MKITLIGGGAHRLLGTLRGTLAVPGALNDGEICLYDLAPARAEAMGRMLLKTPELRRAGCRVSWGLSLEESLTGADAVGVMMSADGLRGFARSEDACLRHGFISSDNVSPTGAMCAVRIAPVILNIARTMERCCPRAWLVNFVNPVAVLSSMVNNHTSIRAMGVCAGFINHLWDIPRLFGEDAEARALEVESAGVNHLSFVTRGRWKDQDLFEALRERLGPDWRMCELQPHWSAGAVANISKSVSLLVRFWRELGVLIFSTEPDGMQHLMYEETVENQRRSHRVLTEAELDAQVASQASVHAEAERTFGHWLTQDLDDAFWREQGKTDLRFKRVDQDVFVRVFSALSGVRTAKVAVSTPNKGAIAGIKDDHVVEYTQTLSREGLAPACSSAGGRFVIPDVVYGLSAALAAHQTMLGEALATEDPLLLARALLAYPEKPYSKSARSLYRELFAIGGSGIAAPYRAATAHF